VHPGKKEAEWVALTAEFDVAHWETQKVGKKGRFTLNSQVGRWARSVVRRQNKMKVEIESMPKKNSGRRQQVWWLPLSLD
jgi:hypothetical protein